MFTADEIQARAVLQAVVNFFNPHKPQATDLPSLDNVRAAIIEVDTTLDGRDHRDHCLRVTEAVLKQDAMYAEALEKLLADNERAAELRVERGEISSKMPLGKLSVRKKPRI